MKITAIEVNPFGEMTYLLWDETTKEGAVVDPGMAAKEEDETFSLLVEEQGITLKYILMTHMHIDHTFGVDFVRREYPQVKLVSHAGDNALAQNRVEQATRFHLPYRLGPVVTDRFVVGGDTLMLGEEEIKVLEAPGHSQGSVLYYLPKSGIVFTGDVVFKGSIGRTDLPGGSHAQLLKSIHEKVITLPASTIILPGHGPRTTVGAEMRSNPFF